MADATIVSEEVPERLIGRGFMRRTPALQATWRWLTEEIPNPLLSEVEDMCFVLLKPDILASKKEGLLWERMIDAGIEPLLSWACLQSGVREFEELYKFNLTLNNDQCMLSSWWLHNQPYQMGPVVGLLIRVPKSLRGATAASDFIAQLKGPSNPFLAASGHWRYDMISTNMALNLVHTSDDPISSVREFRIFGSLALLRRALERSHGLNTKRISRTEMGEAVQEEFRTAIDLAGYPHHDLDLVSNIVRVKLRLAATIDGGEWLSGALGAGYRRLLQRGGTAHERWHSYRSLCDIELRQPGQEHRPTILCELADIHGYSSNLADSVAAEMLKYRLPYSDWERVVINTTLFFHAHLPSS